MKIVVITPTYNERSNIAPLINGLQAIFFTIPHHSFAQLIVDDFSPDGTGDLVRSLQKQYHNLYLIQKSNEGLGAAYIAGIRYAQNELHADAIIQMDADLQHNPNILPYMVTALEQSADVVIASRYIHGGSLPKKWGLFRALNSDVANWLARHVRELHTIQDITSGYRLIRVKNVLDRVPLEKIKTNGYAFLLIFLYHLCRAGARVKEVPLVFEERISGNSKLTINGRYIRDVAAYIKIVLGLVIKQKFLSHPRR